MLNNDGLIPDRLRKILVLLAGGPDGADEIIEDMRRECPPDFVAAWEKSGLFEEMKKEAELERYRNRAAFN